jgi:hypothetical protein
MIVTLEKIPSFERLDKKNIRNYLSAKYYANPLLETKVMEPFKSALTKDVMGKADEQVMYEKQIGDITFSITVKPKTRRPIYKEVYERTIEFISTEKPKIIADKRFIELDKVIARIKSLISEALEGREGFDITIRHSQKEIPEKLVLKLDGSYADLVPINAVSYLSAEQIHEWNKKEVIEKLEHEVKEMVGPGENFISIDREILYVKTICTTIIKYAEIISALASENEKKPGELIKISLNPADELGKAYGLKQLGKKTYISVEKTLQRIEAICDENTSTTKRNIIQVFPDFT